jgi:hypothetical protein
MSYNIIHLVNLIRNHYVKSAKLSPDKIGISKPDTIGFIISEVLTGKSNITLPHKFKEKKDGYQDNEKFKLHPHNQEYINWLRNQQLKVNLNHQNNEDINIDIEITSNTQIDIWEIYKK